MPSSLPQELIVEIIRELIDDNPAAHFHLYDSFNNKKGWDHIRSLTLASRNFRGITLSLWFRQLYLERAADIKDIDRLFPNLKSIWCRHLHCVQHDGHDLQFWDLAGFKRLESVRIAWLRTTITFDRNLEEVVPFRNIESSIKRLDVFKVPFPSPMVLKALILPFVDIVVLRLNLIRTWCGLCNICTKVRLPFPAPKKLLYEGGIGLPLHYVHFLNSFLHLEEITISVPDFGSGRPSPGLSDKVNDNFWMGECDQCMQLMYEDEEFRKDWVAKKLGSIAHNVPFVKPPKLKKVEWNILESSSEEESLFYGSDSDESQYDESE
ncbi:hypothetical protein D9613_010559 [Agrocybe pediades]|uniref:Uncharacterized protein n=1 Tax=Agrocybe pediades TaxID=84607 RepID=A0A8H4VJI5_9AGAR|nr:hypothetical protein D9613_010559 [Agrocybe pediades]